LYVKLLGVTDILNKYRQNFLKTNDFKDLFPLAYYNTTMEELKRIKQGEFTHPREKMEQMLAFFDAYEVNRRLWESGKRDAVEEHWNAHFRIAEGKTKDYRGCLGAAEIEKRSYKYCDEDYFYAVGDVLRSGIDAHVSHDLPRALRFTLNQQKSRGITPEALAGDFNQTNSTLQASSNQTSKEIFRHYKLAQWMDRHTREFAGGDNLNRVLRLRKKAWEDAVGKNEFKAASVGSIKIRKLNQNQPNPVDRNKLKNNGEKKCVY
jgi:hypothetical protein